eukprot:jgi/Bigna1/142366/aug1.69_g17074
MSESHQSQLKTMSEAHESQLKTKSESCESWKSKCEVWKSKHKLVVEELGTLKGETRSSRHTVSGLTSKLENRTLQMDRLRAKSKETKEFHEQTVRDSNHKLQQAAVKLRKTKSCLRRCEESVKELSEKKVIPESAIKSDWEREKKHAGGMQVPRKELESARLETRSQKERCEEEEKKCADARQKAKKRENALENRTRSLKKANAKLREMKEKTKV